MTLTLCLGAALPFFSHVFTPHTLVEQVQNTPILIFAALEFGLALAYLALWRNAPDYRAFLTMGVFFALITLAGVWNYCGGERSEWAILAFSTAALVETAAEAMRIHNHRWTWLLWPAYLGVGIAGWVPSIAFVRQWPIFVSQASLAILLIQGFRHTNVRDRMNGYAFSAFFLVRFTLSSSFRDRTHIPGQVTIGGWRWQMTSIAMVLLGGTTLAIFVRDLIRDRREKLRLTMEVEAARIVQQVLIPEKVPAVAGFRIESVYKPFSEVGGDFAQIFPTSNDGILVVIGDVSGKGMAAAMTVSLLVGTVRTLAHYTQNPGKILESMNQRMLARSAGGFVTCLVVRADRDGSLTIANAGHLSPYLSGKELQLDNGLPLGLAADSTYTESAFSFEFEKQLTLVTDGVVEARNETGELFGFDRTVAIADHSAETIAQKAIEFGQDDDITVITLTRLACPEQSRTTAMQASALSPSLEQGTVPA